MGYTDATLDAMAATAQTKTGHGQLHSGAPGANGTANVVAGGRKALAYTAPATGGDYSLTEPVLYTGLPANQAVTHLTTWDSPSAGALGGSYVLAGDQAANAAGEYTLKAGNIVGSSPA